MARLQGRRFTRPGAPGVFANGGAQEKAGKRRIAVFASLAAVLVLMLGVGYYLHSLNSAFNSQSSRLAIEFSPEEEAARPVKDPEDGSINMLLMGVDHAAEPEDAGEPGVEAAGTNPFSGAVDQRSDSMMLVHIPADRSNIYIMSLVRDMWVPIPGHGYGKLNSAVSFGGVPLVMKTLEGMFDTKIDHVAMIDFEGFRELSTALGGVTVHNDIEFTAHDTDYFYPVGKQTLEGDRALRFVRERKSFVDGDYQRVRNQRKFIAAALDQTLSADTLTNPGKLYGVVDKISPYLSMDASLDAPTVVGLGLQLQSVSPENLVMFTVPTAGNAIYGGESVELADQGSISLISQALKKDDLAAYLSRHPPEE